MVPQNESNMIAYGARCSWWDSKDKVGLLPGSEFNLPCCPHCKSVLFEISRYDWDAGIRKYSEESNNPEYPNMIFWGRGKCFPSYEELEKQWKTNGRCNTTQGTK